MRHLSYAPPQRAGGVVLYKGIAGTFPRYAVSLHSARPRSSVYRMRRGDFINRFVSSMYFGVGVTIRRVKI